MMRNLMEENTKLRSSKPVAASQHKQLNTIKEESVAQPVEPIPEKKNIYLKVLNLDGINISNYFFLYFSISIGSKFLSNNISFFFISIIYNHKVSFRSYIISKTSNKFRIFTKYKVVFTCYII